MERSETIQTIETGQVLDLVITLIREYVQISKILEKCFIEI